MTTENIVCRSFGMTDSKVTVGKESMSLEDFLDLAETVITGTSLVKDDPRITFVRKVKEVRNHQR